MRLAEVRPNSSLQRTITLSTLIDNAEYDEWTQIEVLREIRFMPPRQERIQKAWKHIEELERFTTPIWALTVIVVLSVLLVTFTEWHVALVGAEVVIGIFVLWIGYHQWIRAERNRNVEDAMTRRDSINQTIKDNIEMLHPFVGNVFSSDITFTAEPKDPKNTTLIDLYIYSELDNLEFIYQKARYGLVFSEFAFRAVKIFIARAENEKFASRSMNLVFAGRYNADFQMLVRQLVLIGRYRDGREQ
jgi:hypothetical protein